MVMVLFLLASMIVPVSSASRLKKYGADALDCRPSDEEEDNGSDKPRINDLEDMFESDDIVLSKYEHLGRNFVEKRTEFVNKSKAKKKKKHEEEVRRQAAERQAEEERVRKEALRQQQLNPFGTRHLFKYNFYVDLFSNF